MKKKNVDSVQRKCPYCGGFLSKIPFYHLDRYSGTYEVWVCPNCKRKVSMFQFK